ncbi:FkbM family methyltransferase [Solidesulfovibrio sp.]|uniref:FkbM family methyltransferase n=1 Tax=Solidesulfovibrio sp. TaxID=2910990 RepID=UPI00261F09DC|nr:FkbM family methyltransferase [Solidesulfovibrio sp.]
MDDAKYAIAAEAVAGIREQVLSDAWRGSFRHESFTEKFVEAARRSHCFVDAGAEFGFYAWLALAHMPDPKRLFLFEPEPERHLALQQAFEPHAEVSVLPFAVADRARTIRMYKESVDHSCTLDAALSQSAVSVASESFEVAAVALDDCFPDAPDAVDLVKMDIEGAEVFALQGMERVLAAGRAELFLEYHPAYVRSCHPEGERRVHELLRRHGYGMFSCQGLEITPLSALATRTYLKPTPPRRH